MQDRNSKEEEERKIIEAYGKKSREILNIINEKNRKDNQKDSQEEER